MPPSKGCGMRGYLRSMFARLFPCRILAILAVTCSMAPVSAQIPNGGFESWVSMSGQLDPAGWLTYNDVATVGGATVEQGTPGNSGSFHAVITSRASSGGGLPIQGWMSAGSQPGTAGFPYAQRPAMLTGQWQYGIQPNNTGQVEVALVNSSTQTLIAHGTLDATGSLANWQLFQVPLTYFSNDAPDTAYIQIVSSIDFASPIVGSFMKVDDLVFSGTVGMDDQTTMQGPVLFPSPAADVLYVPYAVSGELRLFDATGRIVLRTRLTSGMSVLNVSALVPGLFTYQMLDTQGHLTATGRWVKE